MALGQIPGNLRSSLWQLKDAILPGGVGISCGKGTERGSAGIQKVSCWGFFPPSLGMLLLKSPVEFIQLNGLEGDL